jgi:hypothetical protein
MLDGDSPAPPARARHCRQRSRFDLHRGEDGIEIRKISGMSKTAVHPALEIVAEHADELLTLWRGYNG